MAEHAAALVDEVLPRVPVRQWVLTLPYRLRYRLAWEEEQPRNRSQPARHWIGREPQALKGVGSEKRLSPRFTKDDKGEFRASVYPDPGAPNIPLHPAAIRQDKGVPGVRDYPQAVEERRRKGRVRGAGVHEGLDSLVALPQWISHLDAHTKRPHRLEPTPAAGWSQCVQGDTRSRPPALPNHLVCPDEHGLWDRQAESLRGLQVDDEYELRGLLLLGYMLPPRGQGPS